jgi:hypothetical protein
MTCQEKIAAGIALRGAMQKIAPRFVNTAKTIGSGAKRTARFTAGVPEGQRYFDGAAPAAKHIAKTLFNPNLGRYGNLAKLGLIGTTATATGHGAYNVWDQAVSPAMDLMDVPENGFERAKHLATIAADTYLGTDLSPMGRMHPMLRSFVQKKIKERTAQQARQSLENFSNDYGNPKSWFHAISAPGTKPAVKGILNLTSETPKTSTPALPDLPVVRPKKINMTSS